VERELMPPMVELQAWQWPRNAWNPRDAQWMLMLSQEFPGRGKRDARAARMEAEARATEAEAPMRVREVAAEVARAYLDLRVAREELAALAEAAAVIRQGVDAAEARYAAGRGMQSDVLAGIVELSRLREEEVMAAERARMAASQLNVLLGRDPDAAIGLLDPVPDIATPPALADLESQQLTSHPERTLVERRVEAAGTELALARQEAAPDYLLQGGFMTMPGMPDAFTARAGVTWPGAPWTKRRTAAAIAAAEAQARAAAAEREAVAQRLRLMAQESIVRADAAQQRAHVLEDTVLPRIAHALEIARIAYQADRGELMPMIDAQRMLVETRLRVRRALADRDRALAELRALLGEYDPDQQ
jgi:outer membrane protein TolC